MSRTAALLRLALAGLLVATTVALPCAAAQTAASCDRACLTGIADTYFTALAAHNPSKAPMAPSAQFTEQAQVVAVGEGLWKTATEAPTTFKIYVPDPVAGQIGGIVMMKDPRSIQVAFRLKVHNGQITEAEHLIAPVTNPSSLANLVTPRPGLLETVPPAERLPRELMLLFGHGYYDALEQSDGKAVPFADDCVRHELGIHTAGPRPPGTGPAAPSSNPTSASGSAMGGLTCAAQLDTRFMSYIEKIELRRVWIADPEKGLVFGLSMFRHPMNEKILTLLLPDGSRGTRDMTKQRQFDMAAAHILKVRNYKIHEIEATGFTLPLNSKNGWNEFIR